MSSTFSPGPVLSSMHPSSSPARVASASALPILHVDNFIKSNVRTWRCCGDKESVRAEDDAAGPRVKNGIAPYPCPHADAHKYLERLRLRLAEPKRRSNSLCSEREFRLLSYTRTSRDAFNLAKRARVCRSRFAERLAPFVSQTTLS